MPLSIETPLFNRPIAATLSSPAVDLRDAKYYDAQIAVVASPSAATFDAASVSIADDTVPATAHGHYTGLKVQLTTADTLPTGLEAATDYWVIVVDANTIAFGSSLANALAGTRVDITDVGVDTATVTATAGTLAHSVQLQKSVDGVNWYSEGSATAISAAGNTLYEKGPIAYRYIRITNTVTTGQAVYTLTCSSK